MREFDFLQNSYVANHAKIYLGYAAGHRYTIEIFDANGISKGSVSEGAWSNSTGNKLLSGNIYIPAVGDYKIVLTNDESGSTTTIKGITLTYGGEVVDVPATLLPNKAMHSTLAFVNGNGEMQFSDETDDQGSAVVSQWAKWKIHVAQSGCYKFVTSVKSANGQSYSVTISNDDETVDKGSASLPESGNWGKATSFATDLIYLTAGDYIVKVQNNTAYSQGRIVNIIATYEGGTTIDIPANNLTGSDAVLVASENEIRRMDNGNLISHNDNVAPNTDYAWWKIRATQSGTVNVKLTVVPPTEGDASGHLYTVGLYSDLNASAVAEVSEAANSWATGIISLGNFTVTKDAEYFIKINNPMNWSSAILGSIRLSFEIPTIADTEENINTVIDAYDGKTGDVQLTRTLVGGMYNTICLPFAVSAAEKARVFGSAKVKELTDSSIESDGFVLNLNFTEVNEMVAGTPYLIKPAANIVNPIFLGVTIDNMLNNSETDVADFIGNFVVSEVPEGRNNYFLSADNKLYYSNSATAINGLRGYFALKNISGSAPTRARIIEAENVVTEIDIVNGEMPETFTNTGKLIENGQLILVRDGIRYNALGVKIK